MTKSTVSASRPSPQLPDRAGIAADRLTRLRTRIARRDYPLRPELIAQAILASDDDGTCGSARAISLTLAPASASNR